MIAESSPEHMTPMLTYRISRISNLDQHYAFAQAVIASCQSKHMR